MASRSGQLVSKQTEHESALRVIIFQLLPPEEGQVKPAICNVYALSGLLRYVETTQAQNRIFFPSCSAAAVLQTTMASFWRENFLTRLGFRNDSAWRVRAQTTAKLKEAQIGFVFGSCGCTLGRWTDLCRCKCQYNSLSMCVTMISSIITAANIAVPATIASYHITSHYVVIYPTM